MPNTLATGAYDGEIIIWNNNSEQASRHMTQRSRAKRLRDKSFVTTARDDTSLSTTARHNAAAAASTGAADTVRQSEASSRVRSGRSPATTNVTTNATSSVDDGGEEDGGFDSHAFITERPKSKSRAMSRVSTGSNDQTVRLMSNNYSILTDCVVVNSDSAYGDACSCRSNYSHQRVRCAYCRMCRTTSGSPSRGWRSSRRARRTRRAAAPISCRAAVTAGCASGTRRATR